MECNHKTFVSDIRGNRKSEKKNREEWKVKSSGVKNSHLKNRNTYRCYCGQRLWGI